MSKVLGKKYVDSKGTIIAVAIMFLVTILGIGGFVFWMIYSNYKSEMLFYELEMQEYENGYISNKPTLPKEPYDAYILIILVTLILGALFFSIIFFSSMKQHSKEENVIILDESTNRIRVLSGDTYHSIALKDIKKVKYRNSGVISTGKVIIPYRHSYGKLTIVYKNGDETIKVVSNVIKDVAMVAMRIEYLVELL